MTSLISNTIRFNCFLALIVTLTGILTMNNLKADLQLRGSVIKGQNGDTTRVENARVFLVGVPAGLGYTADKDRRLMDQVNQTFTPHILPVAAGQTVNFQNSDPSNHNVRLIRDQNDKMLMNKMTYPGQSVSYTFQNEGLIHVRCDIHPNMHAFIPVLEHPFLLDKTGNGGSFTFTLPDSLSDHTVILRAWSEEQGWSSQKQVSLSKIDTSHVIRLKY